jgi:hypothetical protein
MIIKRDVIFILLNHRALTSDPEQVFWHHHPKIEQSPKH